MNDDVLQGKWQQLRGQTKRRWAELTDNDLNKISGRREELAGLLHQKYGYAKERAEHEVDQFIKEVDKKRQL